jgi:hypothetical protein
MRSQNISPSPVDVVANRPATPHFVPRAVPRILIVFSVLHTLGHSVFRSTNAFSMIYALLVKIHRDGYSPPGFEVNDEQACRQWKIAALSLSEFVGSPLPSFRFRPWV